MEQLSLFEPLPNYRYIIDTCAIFSQKPNRRHRRTVYPGLWEKIDALIRNHEMVICSEIRDEIQDRDLLLWLNNLNCAVLSVTDDIQKNVVKVVTSHPRLIDFQQMKSSGDAFLIATAMEYGLTVISEENRDSPYKIHQVCLALGVKCTDILGLCNDENWKFY